MLIDKLNWCYVIKKMDFVKVVFEDKVECIFEVVYLVLILSGLQFYEIIVVINFEVCVKICDVVNGQVQIIEGLYLFVFVVWDIYMEDCINKVFDQVNVECGFINEGWENYCKMLFGFYLLCDVQVNFEYIVCQVYIGFGFVIMVVVFEGVDVMLMEGFDLVKVDEIFGFKVCGLCFVMFLLFGYCQVDVDWLVNLKKVCCLKGEFIFKVV